MQEIELDFEGRSHKVKLEKISGQLWLHWQGETFCWAPPKKSRKLTKGDLQHNDIIAPMPGKIVKLMIKPGDPVKKGDLLILMEAMKMEYSLRSHKDGRIGQIFVELGKQVALHELLVTIE